MKKIVQFLCQLFLLFTIILPSRFNVDEVLTHGGNKRSFRCLEYNMPSCSKYNKSGVEITGEQSWTASNLLTMQTAHCSHVTCPGATWAAPDTGGVGVDQWMTRRAARHLASVSQSALHWSCGRQHQLLTPWPMLDHVIMENVIKNQPDWTKPSFYLQKRIQWCFLCSVQSEHLFTILSLMFGCTRVSSEQCVSLVSWLLGLPGDSVQCSGETWQ